MPRTPPPWRRHTIRAALCLLLGAITTVGGAWGYLLAHVWRWVKPPEEVNSVLLIIEGQSQTWLVHVMRTRAAAYSNLGRSAPSELREAGVWGMEGAEIPEPWNGAAERTLPLLPTTDLRGTPIGGALGIGWAVQPTSGPPDLHEVLVAETHALGWPALALRTWRRGRDGPDGSELGRFVGSFQTPSGQPIPYVPHFPGFLLNTLFYAAPWWLILATPAAIRRWRRHRRGRCIHCGYDLAGLPEDAPCPECGT